jgi:hypothetical protein
LAAFVLVHFEIVGLVVLEVVGGGMSENRVLEPACSTSSSLHSRRDPKKDLQHSVGRPFELNYGRNGPTERLAGFTGLDRRCRSASRLGERETSEVLESEVELENEKIDFSHRNTESPQKMADQSTVESRSTL